MYPVWVGLVRVSISAPQRMCSRAWGVPAWLVSMRAVCSPARARETDTICVEDGPVMAGHLLS